MVSGVSTTSYTSTASATQTATNTAGAATTEAAASTDAAAVYEKSSTDATATKSTEKTNDRSAIINQLKADQDARLSSLKSLVEKMFTKQGATFEWANSTVSDLMENEEFWSSIREGKFTPDEATIKQAQEDISEDGYWGVKQTSDRLVDFAKTLTGGDPDKIETMRKAIQDGFKAAEKLWGGKLPDITQDTYDATMEKLDKWAEEAKA